MRFDANPEVLANLNNNMSVDVRVVKSTVIKLGDKLEHIVHPPDKTTGL